MDKIVPLGTLDGKWPEYTCDRLIELLKHYSVVYFARKVYTHKQNHKPVLILFYFYREGKIL